MAQIVIEFGAETFGPVKEALFAVIGAPSTIDLELTGGGVQQYAATEGDLEAVSRKFAHGLIASAIFRSETEHVRYGLILTPRYLGQNLSLWMGTIELTTEDWRPFWDVLLRVDTLRFVCAGDEEGVELSDDDLSVDSFPWEEWPILAGALRAGEGIGGWVIRERLRAQPV